MNWIFLVILGLYLLFAAYLDYRNRKVYEKAKKEAVKVAMDKYQDLVEDVGNYLLKQADDERPIVLNVRQDKLIENTVNEIQRRERLKNRMECENGQDYCDS